VAKGIVIISFSVFFIVYLLFVVWMNLTPGHFQVEYCGCGIGYFTEKEMKEQEVRANQLYPTNGKPGSFIKSACPMCRFGFKLILAERLSSMDSFK
jgi:hypothetical protein